jgi:hypothetical protein
LTQTVGNLLLIAAETITRPKSYIAEDHVTSRSDSVKGAECDQSVPGANVESDFALLDLPSVEHLVSHGRQHLAKNL